jgi:hypothetical protein
MNDPFPTFISQSGTSLIFDIGQCEEPGFFTLILGFPSYVELLDYEFEIIEDPALLVDYIEGPDEELS